MFSLIQSTVSRISCSELTQLISGVGQPTKWNSSHLFYIFICTLKAKSVHPANDNFCRYTALLFTFFFKLRKTRKGEKPKRQPKRLWLERVASSLCKCVLSYCLNGWQKCALNLIFSCRFMCDLDLIWGHSE